MFDSFSPGSRKVIPQAQILARQMGHSRISSGHLLLAMLENPPSEGDLGKQMLEHFKVSPDKTRLRLLESLGTHPPIYDRVYLAHETENMILAAAKERDRGHSEQLYNHHLILGALAESQCLAYKLLSRDAVTLIAAREYVAMTSQSVH